MNEIKNLSYYINEAKSIIDSSFEKKIRISFLSSFTINGLAETVKTMCSEEKIACITYLGPYNQFNQEILKEDSELYKFSSNLTFLILDTRTIFHDYFYFPYSLKVSERKEFVEKLVSDIVNLVKKFVNKSNSKIIVSNINIPTYSPYGISDLKTEFSLHDMVENFNKLLKEKLYDESLVYIFDLNSFVRKFGEANVFDYNQYLRGDIQISLKYIPYLAKELMGFIKPILGKTKKCIVLDLDNTIWGGIVGEDGFDKIKLGPNSPGNAFVEFQKRLLALNKRGIILAINSKNNPNDALKVIQEHPNMILNEENFACIKINWNDKISNMKNIAKELNIGLDSMVFFDDDPVNREIMKKALPQVLTVDLPSDPAKYCGIIEGLNDFNLLKITNEDLGRGLMYAQERKRKEVEDSIENIDEYLKELDIRITIKKVDKFSVPRTSQLTLKTNQFNLTTKRYQEEEIRKFSENRKFWVGCTKVEDKFGDSGITNMFIINKNDSEWIVDTFLLSCRVMGRGVENAIMGHILKEAKEKGISIVKGQYIPSEKNIPSKDFLRECGFKKQGEFWVHMLQENIKIPSYIKVKIE